MSSSSESTGEEEREWIKRRRFFELPERSPSVDFDTIRMENESTWEREVILLHQRTSTSPLPDLIVERVPTRRPLPFDETEAYNDKLLSEMKEYINKLNMKVVKVPADKDFFNKTGNEIQEFMIELAQDNLEELEETDEAAQECLEGEETNYSDQVEATELENDNKEEASVSKPENFINKTGNEIQEFMIKLAQDNLEELEETDEAAQECLEGEEVFFL